MRLLLGPTLHPEGRSQHDHAAPPGQTGAFPLHAVPEGSQEAVCGAPVGRVLEEGAWPPAQEARCSACEERLADEGVEGRSARPGPRIPDNTSAEDNVSPFGEQ